MQGISYWADRAIKLTISSTSVEIPTLYPSVEWSWIVICNLSINFIILMAEFNNYILLKLLWIHWKRQFHVSCHLFHTLSLNGLNAFQLWMHVQNRLIVFAVGSCVFCYVFYFYCNNGTIMSCNYRNTVASVYNVFYFTMKCEQFLWGDFQFNLGDL